MSGLFAQQVLIFHTPQENFNTGKELFDQGKFAASSRYFDDFLHSAEPTQAGAIQDAEYYLAAVAYELRSTNVNELLTAFIARHPYSQFADRVYFMLGMLAFEKPNYTRALTNFRRVNERNLSERDLAEKQFSEAYALLQTGSYAQASAIFRKLRAQNNRYHLSATYYYAYAEYVQGNLDTALPLFLELENVEAYRQTVPYYIIQIFYKQENYTEVEKRAEQLLTNNPNNPNNAEVYRILGEIAYNRGNFAGAIRNLKRYEELSPQVQRNDMYLLGMSFYKTQDFTNAILYLSRVTTRQDEMTENAFLHIGNSYIRLNDIPNARMAYQAALSTNFDPTIREEALYNFALTTYESNSPFGESITAFERLLTEFPNTRFADSAHDYLTSIYMTTQNFAAAYQSISRIRNKTPQLLETEQYLRLQLGAENFARRNYNEALDFFNRAIQNAPNQQYTAETLFWRAETHYRLGNFQQTINDLRAFFNNPQSASSPNLKLAQYLAGYAYFSTQNFREALIWFNRFIAGTPEREPMFADAMNRIGDSHFYLRDFNSALRSYNRAIVASPSTGDYPLFQIANINGLQRNHAAKIANLEKMIADFPRSQLVDNALYEIGRAYLMLENNERALATYQRLLNSFPRSSLAPKVALEMGMIHFNQGNLDQAIEAFKRVISNYPGSEESRVALESLETAYVEKNNVESFIAFAGTLGGSIQTSAISREDSLMFIAAERQYMRGNHSEAIASLNNFLSRHCTEKSSTFCITARFYLAESYFAINDKVNALAQYRALIGIAGNRHMEDAVKRAAEITYDNQDFRASLGYFIQLEEIASNNENRNIGRLGILRCSYFLNDHQKTITVAQEIIDDAHTSEAVKLEARYNRAKAYIALNQRASAIEDLRIVSENTRTRHGAESKFLLAQVYFDMNNLTESESVIMDFSQRNTPYQYWLARSFVLLADIYILRKDDFQARLYLNMLRENYTTNDDIQTMINTRLEAINQREGQRVIN
jgi:tetratricopeptide (TPR) repeat protein